jgi:predicted regulator of Ras-like GTPase activity (Roadblock/LC7/MglB family)
MEIRFLFCLMQRGIFDRFIGFKKIFLQPALSAKPTIESKRHAVMIQAFDQEQIEKTETILEGDLAANGVRVALLVDMAGHIIAKCCGEDRKSGVYALAALAAGNFGAVNAMAKIVGEDEFSLLFHKGQDENLHFSKVNHELLLITVFGNDVSLGFLRLKIAESIERIRVLW